VIDAVENAIPNNFTSTLKSMETLISEGMISYTDLETMYVDEMESKFDLKTIKESKMEFAYDAMYGAGQNVMRRIFPEITLLHCDYNPGFDGQAPEPIHKNLTEFVSLIRATLPDLKWLEINTNSDFLTIDKVKDLYSAGCNQLTISMYDRDISEQIKTLISGININVTFKHLYAERMELNEVNRDNILTKINIVNKRETCYLPFYKMFIDYDGKVLVCNNDWGRQGVIGDINVHSLYEIWNSDEMLGYRKKLLAKDRDMNPCKFCNINGTLYGKDSFDYYEKYLNQ
jgi:radical SAM protein with 4Fe4S-binding SPASM domain